MPETIFIAITGALSKPRSAVAELINATENGQFVDYITYQTHYLVCAKSDSQKAKKAARLGTSVISEDELMEYIGAGRFPSTELPVRPVWHHNNFPDIHWTALAEDELCLMTYCDARGNTTIRRVLVVARGICGTASWDKWIGGFDGPQFKSWREDRIIELEILEKPDEMA